MLLATAAPSQTPDSKPSAAGLFERTLATEGLRPALDRLAEILADTTEDASAFTEENLKQYAAVVFLCTTGDVLNFDQQRDFERFIQAGGGYVGIHAAADTEYEWGWYGKLVGGYFQSHPPGLHDAEVKMADNTHASTKDLPAVWKRNDEWYNYKKLSPNIKVLLNLDEKTYKGGENGENHPIAWYQEFDGGRAFYTGGGHTDETGDREPKHQITVDLGPHDQVEHERRAEHPVGERRQGAGVDRTPSAENRTRGHDEEHGSEHVGEDAEQVGHRGRTVASPP